jgi:EAL and modified HD-GYP domain-containing signal transduction protein
MDAVMQRPLTELLGEVSLPKDLVDALTTVGTEENRMRQALDLAVAYERANWIKVDRACAQLGILAERLPKIYSDALSWASDAAKAG